MGLARHLELVILAQMAAVLAALAATAVLRMHSMSQGCGDVPPSSRRFGRCRIGLLMAAGTRSLQQSSLTSVWVQHLSEECKCRFYYTFKASKQKVLTKHALCYDSKDGSSVVNRGKKYCPGDSRDRARTDTQSGIGQQNAHWKDIQVNGGNVSNKVEVCQSLFEEEVLVSSAVNEDEMIGAIGCTAGRGFKDEMIDVIGCTRGHDLKGVTSRCLEKEVLGTFAFNKDEMIDVIVCTRGHYLQGSDLSLGGTRLPRKTHRGLEKVSCIGAWHTTRVAGTPPSPPLPPVHVNKVFSTTARRRQRSSVRSQ